MSKLKAVDPKAAEPSKPKILIFGKPGVGKTWTSLDFPSCYYIDTEGGADLAHYTDKLHRAGGVYLGPDQGSLSFETILEQIQALATERHPYRTVVIDSISKLYALEIAREAERLRKENKKNEFGTDKKPAVTFMRRLVAWLTRLDMNTILIAHELDKWGLNDKGEREVVGVTFDAWPKLEFELHLSLNIQKCGSRRLAKVCKTRLLGFPDADTLPWSYEEFAARYGRDIIEKESVQIALATPEQLTEIKRLLNIVRLPDTQIEKWFAAANASSWEELNADQARKCIDALKGRLAQ